MKALFGAQSHFSFHWGTAAPAALFARAAKQGYSYLGIADNASLHGLPEIIRLTADTPVRPLYGAAFPCADGHGVIAHIATADGYGNLCERITEWHARCAAHPEERAGGIPALDIRRARPLFTDAHRTGGLVFIVDDEPIWRDLRAAGAEVYWRIGPTLASPPRGVDRNACLFAPGPFLLSPRDFDTHRLLRAIGGATTLDRMPTAEEYEGARRKAPLLMGSPDNWLQTPAAYDDTFSLYADAIERADDVAERLGRFKPAQATLFPPVPDGEGGGAGVADSPLTRLRNLTFAGAAIRYGTVTDAVRRRLEYELDLIGRKGFAEYFLVVHDIVNRLAGGDGRVRRGRSITCGRGSGAASLVNYCLGVTNVDALKHNLMFERFLNEARADPPDIDVDFAWDERDDVLAKIFHDYGNARVGRVANHNRYDWRGAFRAAARTMGYSDPEITRHTRESPSVHADDANPGLTAPPLEGAPPSPPRPLRQLGVLQRAKESDWNEIARLSQRIIDIPHCLSMHCGGVVISPGILARSVPTVMSRKRQPTIQWEKDGAEDMGLVKIDLLGNRSLAVIRDAVKAVARDKGIPEDKVIPIDPTDDPATCKLVETGDTFGVFYLESPSMRLLMAKARRGDFAHAVINSSIIRPAANAFINEYLERMHGKPWKPEHPLLSGLFDESYGIPVYQEDVVKLAMALGGYDYAKADGIRKCLGKHDAQQRLSAAFPALAEAARARGVDEETLKGFWRTLMSMTGYSFCKPHSASFAQVSYEAAYIRAHHPAHFIAAVLANGGGFYSAQDYVSEAMRLGLTVLGPDINASYAKWVAEGDRAIRTGFTAISGLSQTAMKDIAAERKGNGRYRGLDDFLQRVHIPTDDLRRLILVGGLDALAPRMNRPQLLWYATPSAREHEQPRGKPAGAKTTGSLFARPKSNHLPSGMEIPEPPAKRRHAPPLPDYTLQQRREVEYSSLGFIPGFHPLVLFTDEIRESARELGQNKKTILTSAKHLSQYVGRMVTILAWPVAGKIVETKHGDAMMFQSFEDHEALCEAVIFPEEFQRFHRLLDTLQPLWVTGRVEAEFEVETLRVTLVRPARRQSVSPND